MTLWLLSMATMLHAQATARDCFLHIPDGLMPLLTEVNRADCIDFLDSQMRAEVTNRLGSKSEMTVLTTDYIRIRLTTQSSWQMKVLAVDDSTSVICVVNTVSAGADDSRIAFYSTDWQLLSTATYLPEPPAHDDYLALPTDSTAAAKARETLSYVDMWPTRIDISPDEPSLTFTLTTPDYLSEEPKADILALLLPSPRFVWRAGRFVSADDGR